MMIALTCIEKWKSNTQTGSKKWKGKFCFLGQGGRQTGARRESENQSSRTILKYSEDGSWHTPTFFASAAHSPSPPKKIIMGGWVQCTAEAKKDGTRLQPYRTYFQIMLLDWFSLSQPCTNPSRSLLYFYIVWCNCFWDKKNTFDILCSIFAINFSTW